MIPTTSALPGSGVTLSGRGPDDFKHVGLAGVTGQGSDFSTTPALYKGEQNRAFFCCKRQRCDSLRFKLAVSSSVVGETELASQLWGDGLGVSTVSAVGSLEGSESRTELEAVRWGKVRTELRSELRGEKSESW